jgi:hypothetical protein
MIIFCGAIPIFLQWLVFCFAKQSWRLSQNQELLCARVLMEKYCPKGDLLKAGPKLGSSFAWHSIVAGLQTFKQAHIWRVESGSRMGISLDCNNPTHIMLEYGA